jgi:hypothetical protein
MVTEVVTFKLPDAMTRAQVVAAFRKSVSAWRGNPDLIRKQFLFDETRKLGGGVYLWRSLEDSKRWHGDEYRKRIRETYGSDPSFTYYETPIALDNPSGTVNDDGGSA